MSSKFELLPEKVIKQIASYLLPRDVMNLTMSSQALYNICNSNDVWKTIFDRHFNSTFKKVLDADDWKFLWYRAFLQRKFNRNLLELVNDGDESDYKEVSSDEETVVSLKESLARTDLLNHVGFELKEDESDIIASLSDTDEVLFEAHQLHRSISTESIPSSNVRNSSKTNLMIVPTVSTSSVPEASPFIAQYVDSHEGASSEKISETKTFSLLGFTREELHNRLQNLVKLSIKNSNDDPELSLPGNKTTKFALRYRQD